MMLETDPKRLTVKNAMRKLTDEERLAMAELLRLNFDMFRGGHCTITQMEFYVFHTIFWDDKVNAFKFIGVKHGNLEAETAQDSTRIETVQ